MQASHLPLLFLWNFPTRCFIPNPCRRGVGLMIFTNQLIADEWWNCWIINTRREQIAEFVFICFGQQTPWWCSASLKTQHLQHPSSHANVSLELSRLRRQLEEYLGCLLIGTLPTLFFFFQTVYHKSRHEMFCVMSAALWNWGTLSSQLCLRWRVSATYTGILLASVPADRWECHVS